MKRLVMMLAFFFLLTAPVYAEELPLDVTAVESALDEEARAVSGSLETDGSYDVQGAIARILERAKWEILDHFHAEIREVTCIIAIAGLCAVAETLCGEPRISELISLCSCAAVTLRAVGPLDSLATQVIDAITALNDYARAAMPAVFSAAAVSGAVVSAGAKYAAVCLSLNVMMEALRRITIPLIYAFLALAISRRVFPNAVLDAAAATVKWAAVTAMTILTMGISAYIGMTGALTGSADAAAVKGAKTVISGTLPVVGGILSDAASVVLASAAVIKNSAGVFALIGTCALCLAPFAAISVKMLLFRLCAAIASALEGKRLAGLLGDLAAALGMMMGVLGCMTIMLFIAFMAAIRTVSV